MMAGMDRQYWTVDGVPVDDPGKLVQTATGWVNPSPVRCPTGHPYLPGRTLVGWIPCLGDGWTGHRTYSCMECKGKGVVYWPEPVPECLCGHYTPP